MKYDLIVIGSGPGGYITAIRASQLGMRTALIERFPQLGGTCLNVGCIPSKALLDSSEHYHNAVRHFEVHGIACGKVSVKWDKMLARKRQVIETTSKGVSFLMKKNKITVHTGLASFINNNTIAVQSADGKSEKLDAAHIIIATGSEPTDLPGANFDGKRIISSTQALELPEIPKKLVVIGAGVIGLELGSVYARLGTEVSVIEYMDTCLPTMDREIGKTMKGILEKLGIKFYLGHKVKTAETQKNSTEVKTDAGGTEHVFSADYCLVAVGRRPYTKGLNIEAAGVKLKAGGFIQTDKNLKTDAPNIYAIGDVAGAPMLAHKSEEEGVFVAELLAGQKPHINYDLIPGIVYTWPEVGSVGMTEEQVKSAGIPYKVGKFPLSALGRARASDETDGFVKMIAHKETDRVLGVHIIGARASDLIAEAVTAMEFHAAAEDIARICHGHPTYSEALKEAALIATDNRPLNF